MNILDFLFPKFCVSCKKLGSYICPSCFAYLSFSQKTMCFLCSKYAIDGLTHPHCQNNSLDGTFISLTYTHVVKRLLYHFKYNPYVSDIATIIVDLFYEGLIQKEAFMQLLAHEKQLVIVPIPLHATKLRMRGYNHAALLGERLAPKFSLIQQEYLLRSKETKVQANLSKEERQKNMKGAFMVKMNAHVSGKTILLLDDIVTTGSTFREAAKVLKKAGAKAVYGIAFAGEN